MTTIKEFIKENSPNVPKKKKKKRRVRLKNFNPFRKRKYKPLDEDQQELGGQHLSSADSPLKPRLSTQESAQNSEARSEKRRHEKKVFFHAAWDGIKGNSSDPSATGRKKARKHGSTECLIDDGATTAEVIPPGPPGCSEKAARTEPNSAAPRLPSERSGEGSLDKESAGPGVRPRRVAISDEIEVLDDVTAEEEAPPTKVKKKKSAKKKLKKAGIKTVKMLGYGVSSMAVSFQYLAPGNAISPVAKEISKRREDRYRELSLMAYVVMAT